MTNPISKAGKKLFSQDHDVRRYAAADTAYDEDEYVPQAEDENPDRRKVRFAYFFFPTPTMAATASHPFPQR
jgi:hypothetical protein